MTRAEEIERLRIRIAEAARQHKRKTLSLLFARLHTLVIRQLREEIRKDRKTA